MAAKGSYAEPTEFTEGRSPRRMMAVSSASDKGSLAGKMNLFLLTEDLAGLDLGTGGRVFILDGQGRLVTHSMKKLPTSFKAPAAWLEERPSSSEYKGGDGVPVLRIHLPVPESDLQVIFEQPVAIAQTSAHQVFKRIISALILGALFAGILAVGLGIVLSRPLKELRGALAKMKEGQFDVLVNIRSRDEFGDLARTLAEAQNVLEKRLRDSVLSRMARLIGHDMRQPIQTARTALDTALRHLKEVDEVGVLPLRYCFDAFDHMDNYIEDILTVGRDRPPQPPCPEFERTGPKRS